MKLRINGQTQHFTPLTAFRNTWNLPDTFQIALLEPKDQTDLGSLEQAGPRLAQIREQIIQAVPQRIELMNLLICVEALSQQFRHALVAANTQIGLEAVEIEFAQSGFEDILRTTIDQLIKLNYAHQANPTEIQSTFDFIAVYQQWLDDSVRVSSESKIFSHANLEMSIHLIYNAYGRVGMAIDLDDQLHYVADTALACPAASFMKDLCREVADRLRDAFIATLA